MLEDFETTTGTKEDTMGYSKEIYASAKAKIAKRKATAETEADLVREEFFLRHPEGRELQKKISSAGSKAAMAVLRGGDVRASLDALKIESLNCQKELEKLLNENGLSKKDISPKYTCQLCSDTGYVDGHMCSCYRELVKSLAYEDLNKISPLELSSFDTFSLSYFEKLPTNQRKSMENIYYYCKQYADTFTKDSDSLIFQGGTGLGKTHLSLAIAANVIGKNYGVVYGSTQNFASTIERERFINDLETETVQMLNSCDLLILDDLGTEFPSPYVTSCIYNIIDTRIMRKLPTIISTNLQGEEIKQKYGERLVSRLYGNYNKMSFAGKDIRLVKRGYI